MTICKKRRASVSTHSRLKAAGQTTLVAGVDGFVRFNTQPPEGGWTAAFRKEFQAGLVSTHSRLKAAGSKVVAPMQCSSPFQHTAA